MLHFSTFFMNARDLNSYKEGITANDTRMECTVPRSRAEKTFKKVPTKKLLIKRSTLVVGLSRTSLRSAKKVSHFAEGHWDETSLFL